MARYSVLNKNTGELVCRIVGGDDDWEIHNNDKMANSLMATHAYTMNIDEFLKAFNDKVLIKSDGVETEDTAAQPSAPAQNQEAPQPLLATEEFSKRIEPALTIIKEIMKRAENKRQERAEIDATKESITLAAQGAVVVLDAESPYYVTMDGDGIGNQIARAQYTDDEAKVKEVSRKIDAGMHLFMNWATTLCGTIIEVGGDEGQVKVPVAALDHIEEFRASYLKQVGATVTVGVGKTISQSIQARELGKLRGKNQVVYFDENTEKELNLRLKTEGDQTAERKLIDSGVVGAGEKEAPKLGEQPPQPDRGPPKYGMPSGEFAANQQKQQEYEEWLQSQKKELSS